MKPSALQSLQGTGQLCEEKHNRQWRRVDLSTPLDVVQTRLDTRRTYTRKKSASGRRFKYRNSHDSQVQGIIDDRGP